jgi:2-keto-4-pentenoate hydratase
MTLTQNGKPVATGTGAAILGDPFAALVLLANNPPPWTALRAGAIVTTGSCTVPFASDVPGLYVADFGALGSVSLTVA